jgi:hypothetical protein
MKQFLESGVVVFGGNLMQSQSLDHGQINLEEVKALQFYHDMMEI